MGGKGEGWTGGKGEGLEPWSTHTRRQPPPFFLQPPTRLSSHGRKRALGWGMGEGVGVKDGGGGEGWVTPVGGRGERAMCDSAPWSAAVR